MNLEELQRSPLFRNITPEDLKAMLAVSAPGRWRPPGGSS